MSDPAVPEPLPDPGSDSDFAEWTAWLDRELDAGRSPVPPEREPGGGLGVSLGDAADVDPELLAVMCGPDGLGGQSLGQQFGQDAAGDALRPGPVLAALTEQALDDLGRLDDDQLIGVLRASQRLACREAWKQAQVIAEFARRREAQLDAATAAGVPVHCRAGEFPGEELAAELRITGIEAAAAIDTARQLTARLPATLAAMASGLIDARRGAVIADYTATLTDTDMAAADQVLSAYAIEKRLEQLARKAAALEMRLAPEAVRARKERERRVSARVEVRREVSGNACLSGREMDTASALASKAHIDAIALRLRSAGIDGTLGALRVRVLAELTQGRDPLHLSHPATPSAGTPATGNREAGGADAGGADAGGADAGSADAGSASTSTASADSASAGSPASPAREADSPGPDPAPVPAMINLLVPAGTLLGWSTAPAQAGSHGLLDAEETRDITRAAARHPATRWCITITGPQGTAIAHACAHGQHPWIAGLTADSGHPASHAIPPPSTAAPPPAGPAAHPAKPPPQAGGQLADLFRRLNLTFRPIAEGSCDHASAETQYLPSRALRHLIRARTVTCTAPGCLAQAIHCDLDHTTPHPSGPTCQCNLAPKCRRHHRCKQAPGWQVEQPEPGVMRWILPSGRTHTTTPTEYDT